MRTSRLTGAAALLVLGLIIPGAPSPAGAQAEKCTQPGLGPPTACVSPPEGGSTTTLAPDTPAVEADRGPALWVGAAFGVGGLAGILFANARVRDEAVEERR